MSSFSYTDTKNRLNFPTVARECNRYRISDRAAASIVSDMIKYIGILHKRGISNVVNRNKIRRQRTKVRNLATSNLAALFSILTRLYFDERNDNTKVQLMKNTM